LRRDVTNGESGSDGSALFNALALEEFSRYPDSPEQIAPTMLGNAIRRFEYYSFDRYQLDSQVCWYQLRASVPDSVTKEVDNARSGVDFFVCVLYLLLVLTLTAVIALFTPSPHWVGLGTAAVLGGAGAVGSYYAAVRATDAWASSVKAMVDVGRVPLAKQLGLQIPAKLAEEREMWQRLVWLLGFAYNADAATEIDRYRLAPNTESEDGYDSGILREREASDRHRRTPQCVAKSVRPISGELGLPIRRPKSA
jgi:hypothetical protein